LEKKTGSGISSTRELALKVIYDVSEKGAYTNLALDKVLSASALTIQERRSVSEIVNGTIRMIKRLDWVLNLFVKQGIQKQNPWVRNILRMSVYQLLFMDKIPDYACVNDAVELTRLKTKQAVLGKVVNAVLRNITRSKDKLTWPEDELEYLAVYYSHPEWMVELFLKLYGEQDSKNLLIYDNTPVPLIFRNNSLRCSRDELIHSLESEGVVCRPALRTPWGVLIEDLNNPIVRLKTYERGYFYVQNDSSMLAAPILNPQPGEAVYDLCAGVGGKTTHMAEYMNNTGGITAIDMYPQKSDMLKQNCQRLGIDIVDANVQNVFDLGDDRPKADRILLDAPCSGLGVLNRRADSRWRKEPEGIRELCEIQARMLRKAAEMLAPGGLLLYVTCTINPDENEHQVMDLIQDPALILEGFEEQLGFWGLDEKDRLQASKGMLTIIPGKYDTDGMFYALVRRIK